MPNLRSLTLQCLRLYEEDYYKKLIEKILLLNLKNLKDITLNLMNVSNNYFDDIKGENTSVTNLSVIFKEKINENIINSLQILFQNII